MCLEARFDFEEESESELLTYGGRQFQAEVATKEKGGSLLIEQENFSS